MDCNHLTTHCLRQKFHRQRRRHLHGATNLPPAQLSRLGARRNFSCNHTNGALSVAFISIHMLLQCVLGPWECTLKLGVLTETTTCIELIARIFGGSWSSHTAFALA